jgi:uncharacterized protein YqeY
MSDVSLTQRIQEDVKSAMRNKDKALLGTLRQITAAIKQKEVDERVTLDDAGVLAVLEKQLKQRKDSIEQYEKAGRTDLAEKEKYEVEVIQTYLPQPLTEEELNTLIDEAINASGASSMKEMGKVMAVLKPQVQGRADMGALSGKVKARLGG